MRKVREDVMKKGDGEGQADNREDGREIDLEGIRGRGKGTKRVRKESMAIGDRAGAVKGDAVKEIKGQGYGEDERVWGGITARE